MINHLRTLLARLIVRWLSWPPLLVVAAWGWLMAGTDDVHEKRHCLEEILRLAPDNERAAMELSRVQQQQRAVPVPPPLIAEGLANITQETGIEVIRETVRCPSESSSRQPDSVELDSQHLSSDEGRESTDDSQDVAELEAASQGGPDVGQLRRAPSFETAISRPTEDAAEPAVAKVTDVVGTGSTGESLSNDAAPDEQEMVSGNEPEGAGVRLTTTASPDSELGSHLPTSTHSSDEANLTTELQPGSDSLSSVVDIEFGEEGLASKRPSQLESITIAQAPISTETVKQEPVKRRRVPRQYRPPVRAPGQAREGSQSSREGKSLERPFPIEVRLLFERGGFVRVSLLARRRPELPEEILVYGSGGPLELTALQDNYYQDVMPLDIGTLLRQGIEWEVHGQDGCQVVRWSLSGRELYILSAHNDLSGFVSTSRLVLGKEHVVLCTPAQLPDVQDVIKETGSPTPTLLDSAGGVPVGWIGLQGVLPREPVPQSAEQDILNVLRPLPDAEIVLEGGIRLEYTTWLAGYPPKVCLYGDSDAISEVMIDGKAAVQGPDGSYTVEGWDLSGSHTVWCTSSSRTYSIEESTEEWDTWDAYSWAVYDQSLHRRRPLPTICGALVGPKLPAYQDFRTVVLPATNPVAIGHKPGEIHRCKVRTDIHPDFCIGFAPFDPVWALPADPYHSDKRVARVVLVGDTQPVQRHRSRANPGQIESVLAWYSVILAAGRKGLRTEPGTGEVTALWRAYKRQAKALWKKLR